MPPWTGEFLYLNVDFPLLFFYLLVTRRRLTDKLGGVDSSILYRDFSRFFCGFTFGFDGFRFPTNANI